MSVPGSGPPLALALRGAVPNPAPAERLTVQIALPGAGRATLELADVSGRIVAAVEVGGLGAGVHRVSLSDHARPRPGVYFLRLTQDGRSVGTRCVVLAAAR